MPGVGPAERRVVMAFGVALVWPAPERIEAAASGVVAGAVPANQFFPAF